VTMILAALWSLYGCSGRVPTSTEGPPQESAVASIPAEFDDPPAEPGLVIDLYEADSSDPADSGEPTTGPAVARAEPSPLSAGDIEALLTRVPELEGAEGDRKNFALRAGSKPPPLPGSDVQVPFPPPERPAVGEAGASGPVEVVRFAPEGDVPMAPHVSITFDQPMVAVTSQEKAAKTVPAVLEPEGVPGRWRWLGTRTLLFDAEAEGGRLPMATEYTVRVPAGTRSAAGTALAEAHTFTFRTPPPKLVRSWPGSPPQDVRPLVVLAFDQRVDPEAVLAKLTLRGGGATHPLRLATEAEVAETRQAPAWVKEGDGRTVALLPAEPLPLATGFDVVIPAGTPSAEGPLTTSAVQTASFSTYGPLRVTGHHCWRKTPCPPTAPMVVELSNSVDTRVFREGAPPRAFDPGAFGISPAVEGLSIRPHGNQVHLTGPFVGRTTYKVTVPGSLQDEWGQTLGASQELEFRTGPADKTLEATGEMLVVLDPAGPPALSIWSTNHPALKVSIHRVEPTDWPAWMAWVRKFTYEDARPGKLPGKLVWAGTLNPDGKDRSIESAIDLAPYLEGGHGQFVVAVEPTVQPRERWKRQYVHRWVQVTDLGLVAFADPQQLVGWATELRTGEPAEGVAMSLLSGDGSAAVTATTAADGLAELKLTESASSVLVARRGADVAVLPQAVTPWGDNAWVRFDAVDRLGWYVADDRGLYRPGEQARVKGWLRRVTAGPQGDVAPLERPSQVKVGWTLTSSMGNELAQGEVEVTPLGGFSVDVDIPEDASLGAAQLQLTAVGAGSVANVQTWHALRIEEFRRPEFEVTAEADEDRATLGEREQVELSAAYYAGGALPNAEVRWQVFATPASYSPPGWVDYGFGTWSPWWWHWGGAPLGERHVGTLAGTTDGAGKHRLGMHFRATNPARPWTVRAEGTAIDVNRQAWTASSSILLHPASTYVGLRTAKAFVDRGEALKVDVVVVDVDGAPVARPAEVRFAEMVWGAGPDGSWAERESEGAESCTAAASADGKAQCTFTPARGGSYRVLATVRDAQGRPNESELRVWVSGAETAPARDVALERVTLVPEVAEVTPGQTARILVQAPFWPAEGVLTLRREGLVSTERFSMDGPTTTLEVPILEAYVPNVSIQVDLAGTAPRVDDAGEPLEDAPRRVAHAVGTLDIQIPLGSRTLAVSAEPAQARVGPGAETTVEVVVTHAATGEPVAGAEVAVVVADESVLALTGYRLPDPLGVFYAARGAGVTDHRTRAWLALANPGQVLDIDSTVEADDGAVGRDFGDSVGVRREVAAAPMEMAEKKKSVSLSLRSARQPPASPMAGAEAPNFQGGAIAVRTDLSALALFAPDVKTDAQGRATVPLKLPDSLTRYRIMVVAADADHAFGAGDAAITARLPLMVRPSAPRFLNFGDQLELPVVLQNQTDAPMEVGIAARATNLRFVDAVSDVMPDLPDVAVSTAGRRVTVPANDRVEVRFPAVTLMSGTARLQLVAAAGEASDAATLSLPVWTPATTEAFATYGSIEGEGVVQPVEAPPDTWTQFGGLSVTTSSTQLQALTDAVLYLQSYPFECNEQLASRVLAIASLRDVLSAFEAPGLPPADALEAQVGADLDRLAARQHWNGGFAFWRKGDRPWPFLSIHVANAFARARGKGFAVPDEAWTRSLQHLRDIRSHIPRDYSQEAKWFLRAYALDVRRRMGDPDVREARALYKEASPKLGIDGLAFLLPTLHEGGATAEVDAILRHLGNQVTESAGTAHFVTSYSDGAQVLLHSDRRADGIVLEALMSLEQRRDDELIQKVVRGLLGHRTKGRWGNTQENAFVLLALDRYFAVYEAETPDFVARIWLGDGYAGEHAFRGRTTERAHLDIPMGLLTEHPGEVPLTLVRDGDAGRLYYRIGLRYAPRSLRLDAADYGFAVERRYEGIDDPADVRRDADGTWRIRAGARVRVTVTMATPMRRNHVALVDPLPAGLEAENPALATSGTLPDAAPQALGKYWWWSRTWWEHDNLRDERVEAFSSLVWDGVHTYEYQARATTPGRFVVPPAKAEEMYAPETFGRSATDRVVIE
jgi:alpha-2-macroglobulin